MEKAFAKSKLLARQRNNYERPGNGNTLGYAEDRNGQRLYFPIGECIGRLRAAPIAKRSGGSPKQTATSLSIQGL
jgi:hypothetical protein